MRLILFFIGGVVLANIVTATFFWHPSVTTAEPVVNAATRQGQEPWMVNERYNVHSRELIRKGVLETLDEPWGDYCTDKGHQDLIRTINGYYYERSAQAWSYGNTYGEAARRYALEAWTTPDDNRIERLISETYSRGYFSLDDLRPYARTPLAALVKDAHVTAKPCTG